MAPSLRPIFEIYVHDDRYAVPTLHLVPAQDAAAARAILDRLLQENAHHLGGEVCLEGRILMGMGTLAQSLRSA